MQTVTIYEATNPSGSVFTARLEGLACKGEGHSIAAALHNLADDLDGAKGEATERACFVTDFRLPSCTECGKIYRVVCVYCGNGFEEAQAILAAIKSKSAENAPNRKEETGVAPTPKKVDNPGSKISLANQRQVAGSHYRSEIQHWDYVVANDIPYLEAQVIKYLTRWRKKNGLEDVRKAQHYLDKLIEVETARQPQARFDWEGRN